MKSNVIMNQMRRNALPDNFYEAVPKSCMDADLGQTYRRGFGVEDGVLAAVYAPLQEFDRIYDLHNSLSRGTMFRELDKPFCGGKELGCRGQQR